MVFDYASDPEHQIIPVNIVPRDNLPYLKQCEIKVVKPEDKAFPLMIYSFLGNTFGNALISLNTTSMSMLYSLHLIPE